MTATSSRCCYARIRDKTDTVSRPLWFRLFITLYILQCRPTMSSSLPSLDSVRRNSHNNRSIKIVPQRLATEAAVIEWGSSAEISAIDAAVASFGPQTSLGAYFEVETTPILADPVDGVGGDGRNSMTIGEEEDDDEQEVPLLYPIPLKNKQQVKGNMLVMTNSAHLSGVQMAKIAVEAEAEALMIVNMDSEAPDSIYSLQPLNEEERLYAQEHVGIPIVMVSLASGNMITTATVQENTNPEDIVNNGMPERIRMYAAGDRPFFEDCSSSQPVLYLIHNLFTQSECQEFIQYTERLFPTRTLDGALDNYLEGTLSSSSSSSSSSAAIVHGQVSSVMLWKGPIPSGNFWKQMDDRIEQITGYPKQQFSHWIVTRFSPHSSLDFHYDRHPLLNPVVTISVFLNSIEGEDGKNHNTSTGGEAIYLPKNGPEIHILPRQGLAFVHHNTDFEQGTVDKYAFFAENSFDAPTDENPRLKYKYVARRFVYASTLSPNRRILLPLVASLNGGKLPRLIVSFHDILWSHFGPQKGSLYFDKICYAIASLWGLVIAAIGRRAIRKWGFGVFINSTASASAGKRDSQNSSDTATASRLTQPGKKKTQGASKKEE